MRIQNDGDDVIFYLFGDQYIRNRVFWHVDRQIREECGIKDFTKSPKMIDIELIPVPHIEDNRTPLMRKIREIFRGNLLSDREKTILALLFNLSEMEQVRAEGDIAEWTVQEVSIAMNLSETEVKDIRRRALEKLKPYLSEYS